MMAWRPLYVSASAGAHLPPLLISTNFTTDAYTIHLTDLTSIWTESLDRRAIIRRSQEENTSIDPNDTDQFQIFQQKIKLGLGGGQGTALSLTILADASRPSLVLTVTVDLPGGLAPLEWPIRLAAAPQTLLTSQLTRPLLKAQHERQQEMTALADILKEKDHVIQKLLDKLESQGTEIGQVFPQVGRKVGRKVDRKKAAERVKGLAPFDVGVWREELAYGKSRDTTNLVGEVFGSSADALSIRGDEQIVEDDSDEWWENIKGITISLDTGKISTRGPLKKIKKTTSLPKPPLRKEESSINDVAFQVQATPPSHSRATKVSSPKAAADESTDDDDLNVQSRRSTQHSKIPDSYPKSPSPPPKAPSPKPIRKIGKIGGKKEAPKKPSPPIRNDESTDEEDQTRQPSPPKKFDKIGRKKEPPPPPPESETDDEPEVEPAPEPAPPPKASTPPAVIPKKGKFGQIGGKKKAAQATPAPEQSIAEASTTSPTPKTGVKRKLSAIGHKNSPSKSIKQELASQNADDEIVSRGRASEKPEKEPTPPPRETSEERADRKREELKRELEEKAKAPVKKKRKF